MIENWGSFFCGFISGSVGLFMLMLVDYPSGYSSIRRWVTVHGGMLAIVVFAAFVFTGCGGDQIDPSTWSRWRELQDPAHRIPVRLIVSDDWGEDFVEAMELWEEQAGAKLFRPMLDRQPPRDQTGQIVIIQENFQDYPEEFTRHDPTGQWIVSSTILVPPHWSDMPWAAAHELGHALGIPHLEGCRSCLMAPEPPPFPKWEISAQALGHVRASMAKSSLHD